GRPEVEVIHGDEDAALRRLEAIADVGQRAADDDRHGVGHVAFAQLLGNAERFVVIAVGGGFGRRGRGRGSQVVRQGSLLEGSNQQSGVHSHTRLQRHYLSKKTAFPPPPQPPVTGSLLPI